MSTDTATAFAERLKSDEALQKKLLGAADRGERLRLAREEGFDLSADDVGAVRRALGVEELSDADLERVAGGSGSATAGTVIYSVAGSAVASLTIAAASVAGAL